MDQDEPALSECSVDYDSEGEDTDDLIDSVISKSSQPLKKRKLEILTKNKKTSDKIVTPPTRRTPLQVIKRKTKTPATYPRMLKANKTPPVSVNTILSTTTTPTVRKRTLNSSVSKSVPSLAAKRPTPSLTPTRKLDQLTSTVNKFTQLDNDDSMSDPSLLSDSENKENEGCVNSDSTLKEIATVLKAIVKRMDHLERKIDSKSSESSSDSTIRKAVVPKVVRSETRLTYKTLLDGDDDFTGFDTSANVSYKHPTNQAVASLLLKEVQGNNTSFSSADIRAAIYTYYKSLCQEQALKRNGSYDKRRIQRRRRERVVRRLNERQSEFMKLSYSNDDRAKWGKIFRSDMISSDESDIEDGVQVLVVNQLKWRGEKVDKLFQKLDTNHKSRKSEQANRQTKPRIHREGVYSQRPIPQNIPSWAVLNSSTLHH